MKVSVNISLQRAHDAIFRAVQEAIDANMTVNDFRLEAAECWQCVLSDMKRYAAKDWNKL